MLDKKYSWDKDPENWMWLKIDWKKMYKYKPEEQDLEKNQNE